MRLLLIADAGDGLLDLALRAQALGHQVRFFCRKYDPQTRPIGRGLVERVADWRPSMTWCDLAILEANGCYMHEMDAWRERGKLIVGGNEDSAAWELDRTRGMQVFKEAGIAVPPYREFTDYESAVVFVERRGEVFYSKPCSDTADKSLSAKTGIPEDPAYQLRKWKRKHGRPPCPFLLQEAIEGVEMGIGAWFGPAGFAEGWEENFEHKRFCAGDIGPNTGEMGTVLRYVRKSKLADKVLAPFEYDLAAIGYVGNIDCNCIISGGDVFPLEWTTRLGWPSFNIETDLFDCDPIEFLAGLASGEPPRKAHKFDEIAVGVVCALPPFPFPPRAYDEIVGVPLYGLDEVSHWHSCEVMSGKESKLATAGHYVGLGVGVGGTVRQAAREAYKTLGKLSMPGSPFWRIDIGGRLKKELPRLQAQGFAAGMEF
jgi:phosphoribosylamine--glycine ligase